MLKKKLYRYYKNYIKIFIPKIIFRIKDFIVEAIKGFKIKRSFKKIIDEKKIKALKFKKIKNISFKKPYSPSTSIIIPVYNNWKYTYTCLRSIKKNVYNISYELIVVDNCSNDETKKLFEEKINGCIYLRQDKNYCFVEGCNVGIRHARGEYIVFLNNDTFVLKKWLKYLLNKIKEFPKNGIVGSKLIYPNGKLQEAGGIVFKNKDVWNYGNNQDPLCYEYNYTKEVDYCSAAAIITRKSFLAKAVGFDDFYKPAFFEDTDLAFQARKLGYKVLYEPKARVIHFEGKTAGKDEDDKGAIKSYQRINKNKFFNKWKKELIKQAKNPSEVFIARDRSMNKKVMLVLDYKVPNYKENAGLYFVFNMLLILNRQSNYKIIYWPDNLEKLSPYTEILQNKGIEVVYGNVKFKNFIKKNGKFIDCFVLARPDIGIKYINQIKKNSDAKIIYLGHDLHMMRLKREKKFNKKNKNFLDYKLKEIEKQEIKMIEKSDISLYFSEKEIAFLRKKFPNSQFRILRWVQGVNKKNNLLINYKKRKYVIFVGSSHPPNLDGIFWFHRKVLPLILKENPKIKILIIGKDLPEEILRLNTDNFKVVGFVDELGPYFNKSRVFIAPLRFGAGIKGKILLSLSYGVPVVTTEVGKEGIDFSDMIIAGNAKDFADKIMDVYNNEEKFQAISQKSINFIKKNFSKKSFLNDFKEILKDL